MIRVVIKKEICESWISDKSIKDFKRKFIHYFLYTTYWKLRGYEVEEVEEC